MSYGDDVDLLYVYDTHGTDAAEASEFFIGVGCDLTAALKADTHDGALYRVELPLWPKADGWLKACSLAEYSEHYAASDDMGERLALARARPIAGDAELGGQFMALCQPFVHRHERGKRAAPASGKEKRAAYEIDVLTQAFQLAHGAGHAALRHTGTLGALDAMAKAGLIPEQVCRELDHAYVFLRAAEHRRQLGLGDADVETQVERSKARVREICASIDGLAD